MASALAGVVPGPETFARFPRGTRAVPDRPAPRHKEGKPSLPERWRPKFDRHLPSENRDLQGKPGFQCRTANLRRGLAVPIQATGASSRSSQAPEGASANRPVSDPKAAAPCCRQPEGRLGKAHEEAEAASETAGSSCRSRIRRSSPSELLLRRAGTLGRGSHRRCQALSRASKCSPESSGATI